MEQQTLTKAEAIQALKEGKKLTHRYFCSHVWIRQEGFTMIMEDGASIDTDTFWKDRDSTGFLDGWYIKEEPQQTLKTHEVLDLHYHEDEGQGCFVGTLEECNEFVSQQGISTFMYKVVPMTKEEIENYPDNQKI